MKGRQHPVVATGCRGSKREATEPGVSTEIYFGFQIISASALVARGCDGRRSMGDGIFKASLSNPVRQNGLWLQLGDRSQVQGSDILNTSLNLKRKRKHRKKVLFLCFQELKLQ